MSYIVSEVYEVFIAVVTVVLLTSLFTGAVEGQGRAQQPSAQASSESPGTTDRQIKARLAAKAQRTPAQRKVSSQLLDARRAAVAARRQAKGEVVEDEMVMVDIRADVTPAVLARIRALRGTVINSVARYRAIRARLPLEAVERLAVPARSGGSERRVMPIRSLSVNPKGVVLVKTDIQIHIDIGIDGFQREDSAGGRSLIADCPCFDPLA